MDVILGNSTRTLNVDFIDISTQRVKDSNLQRYRFETWDWDSILDLPITAVVMDYSGLPNARF